MRPQVFISYSREPGAHNERVRRLADRLKADGLCVLFDQDEPEPPLGLPHWMEAAITESWVVVSVCTPTYRTEFEAADDHSEKRGVRWEGRLIKQILYESGGRNTKFVPVVLSASNNPQAVPLVLRPNTIFVLDENLPEDGYSSFCRELKRRLELVTADSAGLDAEKARDSGPRERGGRLRHASVGWLRRRRNWAILAVLGSVGALSALPRECFHPRCDRGDNQLGEWLTADAWADLVAGTVRNDLESFRKGEVRAIYEVGQNPMPITGDADTTCRTTMPSARAAYIQGRRDVVKLQRIRLPKKPRQLRGWSDTGHSEGVPLVWGFVAGPDGFRQLSSSFANTHKFWSFGDTDSGLEFHLVALYPDVQFFQGHTANTIGVEVDDLAGRIESLSIVAIGRLPGLQFHQGVFVVPGAPSRLYSIPAMQDQLDPKKDFSDSFSALVEEIKRTARANRDATEVGLLTRVAQAVDEAKCRECTAVGRIVRDARHDVFVHVTGERAQ